MKREYSIIFIALIFIIFTTGCTFFDNGNTSVYPSTQPSPQPTSITKMSTLEPSEMALQLFDLPTGYTIKDRYDVAYADVSTLERDEGWKKGYYAAFYRMNINNYDITGIIQQISVYPLNSVSLIFDNTKNEITSKTNSSVSVVELPFPKVGDQTISFRTNDSNDPDGIKIYTVIFTKKDVFEKIEMKGTTTDYEVLKNFAQKAADKIR